MKSINYEDLLRSIDNSAYNKRKEIEEELKKIHDAYLSTMKKVDAQREDKEWKDYI